MRYRLALIHRALPGATLREVASAVYGSHARARRAMRAPSRVLESVNGPIATSIRSALVLSRTPKALELIGVPPELTRVPGPPPSPRVASVEFFSFESAASLGDALAASRSELSELALARHECGVGTSWSALRVRELVGVSARPSGLSNDVGLLFSLRRPANLSRAQMHSSWEAHAELVQRHAAALGYEYYAQALALDAAEHGLALRVGGGAHARIRSGAEGDGSMADDVDGSADGAETRASAAGARAGMGSVIPGATLSPADALGVLTFPSLASLVMRAANPAASAANIELIRDEAHFVYPPATSFEIVRWRPVPHEAARAAVVERPVAQPDVAIA